MLHCCEGHVTSLLLDVEADDVFETGYRVWLTQEEVIKLLHVLEGSDCPVCSGMVPLPRTIVGQPLV